MWRKICLSHWIHSVFAQSTHLFSPDLEIVSEFERRFHARLPLFQQTSTKSIECTGCAQIFHRAANFQLECNSMFSKHCLLRKHWADIFRPCVACFSFVWNCATDSWHCGFISSFFCQWVYSVSIVISRRIEYIQWAFVCVCICCIHIRCVQRSKSVWYLTHFSGCCSLCIHGWGVTWLIL